MLGETGLLSVAPWPTYDEAKTVESTVELAVQVNGKLKCTIKLRSRRGQADCDRYRNGRGKGTARHRGQADRKADRCSGQDRKPCRKVRRNAGFPRQKEKIENYGKK